MGREIRRVPPDWEHPRNGGQYIPLYDEDYVSAADAWLQRLQAFEAGNEERREAESAGCRYLWDWDGGPPNCESYRTRKWTDAEATHFQVYETVSEGTPVSPVLPSREAVRDWAISQGHSQAAAAAFAESGYVPSLVIVDGLMLSGIDSAVLQRDDGGD